MALTEKRIRDMKPGRATQIEWDDVVRGLGVRIIHAGVKSYILNYRAGGSQRRMTIGRTSEVSLSRARQIAGDQLVSIRAGADPLALRRARADAPTMAELFDRYISDHALPHKKPLSIEAD